MGMDPWNRHYWSSYIIGNIINQIFINKLFLS